MSGHITVAKVDGHTYEIPDIWLAGMCLNNGYTLFEAIQYWHWQSQLEEQSEEQSCAN